MITKFEWKIIAGCMAAIMSFSLVTTSTLPVYAETTESIVLEEDESTIETEISSETEPMLDPEMTPEIEEEIKTETIPETEKDLDSKTKPEAEKTDEEKTVPNDIARIAGNMNETADDNIAIADEITLKADGTMVRTETVIPADGDNYVFYSIIPEEDGEYYLNILDGGYSVYKDTENGREYVESRDNTVYLEKNGKYFIEIFSYSDSNSVRWDAGKITDVQLGDSIETAIDEPGRKIRYNVILGEQEIYCLQNKSNLNIKLINGDKRITVWGEAYECLDAGEKCYVDVALNDPNATMTASWKMTGMDTTIITVDEKIHTSVKGGEPRQTYKFIPEEEGRYSVSYSGASVFDSDMNILTGGKILNLKKGEIYYIQFNNYSDEEIDWSVNKIEIIPIAANEKVQTVITEGAAAPVYSFVPDESRIYGVIDTYGVQPTIYDKDWNVINMSASVLSAKECETYYISFDNSQSRQISWKISKLEEITAVEGESYRAAGGAGKYYKFIPQDTGTYTAKYSNGGPLQIYDSQWQWAYGELNGGETYYLYPSANRYWSIEKSQITEVEEVEVQLGEVYEQPKDSSIPYTFTPEESSRYYFYSKEGANINIRNENSSQSINGYGWKYLEEGTTYTISMYHYSSALTWYVIKADMITIEEGKEYTTAQEESREHCFVPKKTGYYVLTSSNVGKCIGYDEHWSMLNTYNYAGTDGFGTILELEEGKTYYFDIFPDEEQVMWKIDLVSQEKDYVYKLLGDDQIEILAYTGSDIDVKVPEQIDGKTVSSIGEGAFSGNTVIERVAVPSKVTELQYGAFLSCANLQTVVFAENSQLQTIGDEVFQNCGKLSEIELPESVKRIQYRSFSSCKSLSELKLGKQLEVIGEYAFSESGLRNVDIPDSVTEIGRYAFSKSAISRVSIGSGLEGIGKDVFNGCKQLEQIELPDNITYIESQAFASTGLTSIKIPDTVQSIGEAAFGSCHSLKNVEIGNGLAYIAPSAFSNCNLTEITWGDKVQSIGEFSFSRNTNLETISIPNSVTEIEYGAFSGCTSLLEIEIPDTVEAIGGDAFSSFYGNTTWYDNQAEGDVYAGKVYYKYKGKVPEGTEITIKDGTKGIAGYAFDWQEGLYHVEIPESVTNIGDMAFYGCESLQEIKIPGSVTQIGDHALGYLEWYENGYELKKDGFTIYGMAGSAAQAYAEEHGFTFVVDESMYIKGDVNGNGLVDIADCRMTLRSVCDKDELTESQKLAADVEKDDTVDIKDIRKILRYICKKIEEL